MEAKELNTQERAAFDGDNAKTAHAATQSAWDVEQLIADLGWHKDALKRQTDKLASVWSGMTEMMLKTLGHQCSTEPFNDLEVLLLELKTTRASRAITNRSENDSNDSISRTVLQCNPKSA